MTASWTVVLREVRTVKTYVCVQGEQKWFLLLHVHLSPFPYVLHTPTFVHIYIWSK
jgi:hypothetical protein